jgi:hypothetical protein
MAHAVRKRYWSAVIADFHRSGLTQAEFCRRRRVPPLLPQLALQSAPRTPRARSLGSAQCSAGRRPSAIRRFRLSPGACPSPVAGHFG